MTGATTRRYAPITFGLIAIVVAFGFLLSPHGRASAGMPACPGTATPGSGTASANPDYGHANDQMFATLSNIAADSSDSNYARVFLNTSAAPGGDYVGESPIPMNGTGTTIQGFVPNDAPGQYTLIICWDSHLVTGAPVQYWVAGDSPFTILPAGVTISPSPTPSPSASPSHTPSPTASPTPTHSPTPTPHPSPTPTVTPAPFRKYAFNPALLPNYLAPFLLQDDFSIFGMEVTEGEQCFDTSKGLSGCPDNSLALVTQKDATIRIYLSYAGLGTTKAGIPVRLHIFAAGKEYIVNTWGTAHKTLNQADTDTANVWFNVNFGGDVDVSFYAEVDPDHLYAESNESNNRYPASGMITKTFFNRQSYNVLGWLMNYHPAGAADSGTAGGWAATTGGPQWLNLVWPVKNGGIHYGLHSGYLDWTSVINSGGESAVVAQVKILALLESIFPWFGPDPQLFGQDRVHVWTPSSHFVRGLSDPGFGGGLGVASVGTDSFNAGMSIDSPGFGPVNFVHEVSHNSGMHHTATGLGCDTSADSGTDWPYADPKIQEFGFNPDTGHIYDPSNSYDFMSYCYGGATSSWISPFHWNQQFGVELSGVSDAQPQAIGGDVLGITATIDNPDVDGDDGGTLGTLYKTADGGFLGTAPPGTGYAVQLRNGDQVLSTQQFGVSFVPIEGAAAPTPEPPLPSVDVAFTMPWTAGATSVVLLRGTDVLDTVNVSGHAPTVDVTSPVSHESWAAGSTHTITWTAADEDGDALTYSVFFSHDNGTTWQALAANLTGTSYDAIVDTLAGGQSTKFRVVANDGVNTGFGDSAAVTIPNKPPLVAITNPPDGAVVSEGGLAVLEGAAADLEDGSLTGDSLAWSSDKDGALGTGESLPIDTLSAGQHTITLTATDSDGAFASKSITLIVGVRANLHVRPSAIDPNKTDDVPAIVTLPPGMPATDIKTSSLRLHVNGAELTPRSITQLGDTDQDGLPELELMLDGQALRAALTTPRARTEIDLSGTLNDGTVLAASDQIALIAPGDVDCTGTTNGLDVIGALEYTDNIGSPDCLFAGDLTCDGDVTTPDVLGILGEIAGVSIPAGSCPAQMASAVSGAQTSAATANRGGGFGLGDLAGLLILLPALWLPAMIEVRRKR